MNYLFQDVSLASIGISGNGRTFNLEFINMYDGGFLAELILESVMIFNYHNNFDGDAEGLPIYIGEVTCQELTAKEAFLKLLKLGYQFKLKSEEDIGVSASEDLFHVHIESGEVVFDIICGNYSVQIIKSKSV